jgi:iron transport multicopper oxidase
MYLIYFIFLTILSYFHVECKVVEHDWTVGWTLANPDGRLRRPVVSINNQWPNPELRATVGDTIRITARNALGNETLSFHWHGLFQNGTNAMDGPMQVTQCPILPGQSYTYEFDVSFRSTVHDRRRSLTIDRSNKQAHTGTIRTRKGSTETAFAAH